MTTESRPAPTLASSRLSFALTAALVLATLPAAAATVSVPADHGTIQGAIDAVADNLNPGVVIIESSLVFTENLVINESVTVRAAWGYRPVVSRFSGSAPAIRVDLTGEAPAVVQISGLTVQGTGIGGAAVKVENSGQGPGFVILEDLDIEADNTSYALWAAGTNGGGSLSLSVLGSSLDSKAGMAAIKVDRDGQIGLDLRDSILRLSDTTSAIDLEAGRYGAPRTLSINRCVFEGYDSVAGGPGGGVGIVTSSETYATVVAKVTNSLFSGLTWAFNTNLGGEVAATVDFNNNTVVNTEKTALYAAAHGDSSLELGLANTIVSSTGWWAFGIGSSGNGVLHITSRSNVLHDSGVGHTNGGAPFGVGTISADPLFVDPAGGDFRLAEGSPAIDSGVDDPTGGFGIVDLESNDRVVDGDQNGTAQVDRGAYEAMPLFADDFETGSLSRWSTVIQ